MGRRRVASFAMTSLNPIEYSLIMPEQTPPDSSSLRKCLCFAPKTSHRHRDSQLTAKRIDASHMLGGLLTVFRCRTPTESSKSVVTSLRPHSRTLFANEKLKQIQFTDSFTTEQSHIPCHHRTRSLLIQSSRRPTTLKKRVPRLVLKGNKRGFSCAMTQFVST